MDMSLKRERAGRREVFLRKHLKGGYLNYVCLSWRLRLKISEVVISRFSERSLGGNSCPEEVVYWHAVREYLEELGARQDGTGVRCSPQSQSLAMERAKDCH